MPLARIIPPPTMDKEIQQAADFYRLVAWAHKNRKPLILALVGVVVIGGAIGIRAWHRDYAEEQANTALMAVKLPNSVAEAADPKFAEGYHRVATDHPGTTAAARALLLAAGVNFNAGQFEKSKTDCEQYLREYSDFPLTGQALVGVAASYEAMGNVKEATAKYDDIVKHHTADAVASEAKSALARLYLAQNQPDQALRLYEELERDSQARPDSWTTDAKRQAGELLAKYPNLRKPVAMPTNSMPMMSPTLKPTVKLPAPTNQP